MTEAQTLTLLTSNRGWLLSQSPPPSTKGFDLGNNLTLGETNEKFTFTQFTAVNR